MESEAEFRRAIDGFTHDLIDVVTEIVHLRQIERPLTVEETNHLSCLTQKKNIFISLRNLCRLRMYQYLLSPDADDAEKSRLARYCGLMDGLMFNV